MNTVVFDNIIFSLQEAGGISKVWCDLLQSVAPQLHDFSILEYNSAMANRMRGGICINPSFAIEHRRLHPAIERMTKARYHYAGAHVFHSSYYRTSCRPEAKNVTTVHDFINERYNHGVKSWLHTAMKRRAILAAEVIVCVSAATRDDLLTYIPEVRNKDIIVIGNAVDEDFAPGADTIPALHDTLLFVGTRDSYKNFMLAAEAAELAGMRLCVCGKPISRSEQRYLDAVLPGRWLSFAYPDNKLLNRLYNSVFALIYPSSYEGFGLPVAEAQKAGCPAIALRTSSIPEVSGNAPTLVERSEARLYANMIDRLKSDRFRAEAIAHGLTQHTRYTARAFSQAYFDIYSSL